MDKHENEDYYNIAEIKLTYIANLNPQERPQITCANQAYDVFRSVWDESKMDLLEEAKLMLLNRNNRVLGICNLSSGGVAATVIDNKLAFAAALKANASSILLAHNHPSGNLTPSSHDKRVTKELQEGAKVLGLEFHDHLIITRGGFYSFSNDQEYLCPEPQRPAPTPMVA